MPTLATPTGFPSRITGSITHATEHTLTDHIAHWKKDAWVGDRVYSTSNGRKTFAKVTGNDRNTLTVDDWSDGIPDPGATYEIEGITIAPDITPDDIALAIILWGDDAPRQFRGLLNAGRGSGGGDSNGWTWNPTTQQYVGPTGKPLSDEDLKNLSVLFAVSVEHDIRAKAEAVATGRLSIADFQNWLATTIKSLYTSLAALAIGGWRNLTSGVLSIIQGVIDHASGTSFSFARLQQFAQDIQDGTNATVEAIVNRAGLYADSGLPIYEAARVESHANARDDQDRPLFLFYRNNLTPGDNCSDTEHAEGCVETTSAGWQLIGTLPEIGLRSCAMRCRCWWSFSLTGTE